MRITKVRVLIELLFLILLSTLSFLQLINGGLYYSLSNKNCIRLMPVQGARGKIFDHNGQIIVNNKISYNISIIPQEFRRNKDALLRLSSLVNISPAEINKIIRKESVSAFIPLIIRRDVDKKLAILVEENKFGLPGVAVQIIPKRSYPYGNLASHVLGYLSEIDRWRITRLKDYGYKSTDIVGFSGIEEAYDQFLRAQEGGTQVRVDHRGRIDRVISFRLPKNGKDIRLTIDLRIQKIVEEELSEKKGAVIIMEPYSGKIIALASAPDFSPVGFLNKDSQPDYIRTILSDFRAPMVNRAISGRYPLGSVFKVISAVAALGAKKITLDKRFFCPGKIFVGVKEFRCLKEHNSQNLIEALVQSCNVYFYRLALLIGPDILSEYALRFGLGRACGIDLPNEVQGNVPSVLARRMKLKSWYDGDTANFGIGQGDLLVTPIQILRVIASLVNGGRLVKPYIVEAVGIDEIMPEAGINLGLDSAVLKTIRIAMRQAVAQDTGTAHLCELEDLQIAGKTGTAQVQGSLPHGWFVGFVPYEKPEMAFCVFLENSGSSAYAVMLARQIFLRMLAERLIYSPRQKQ